MAFRRHLIIFRGYLGREVHSYAPRGGLDAEGMGREVKADVDQCEVQGELGWKTKMEEGAIDLKPQKRRWREEFKNDGSEMLEVDAATN